MAARFPQSGSSVAYQIKSAYSSKIKALYWAASADSVHRLRPGDTASTIVTRSASGAGFNADGRITGNNSVSFSDSTSDGLNTQSDFTFGAFYYGDFFNGVGVKVLLSTAVPPDTFTNGNTIRTDTYTLQGLLVGGAGGVLSAGIGNDVPEYIDIALRRNATDPINTYRQWFNGSEQTSVRKNAAANAATSITTLYFGDTNSGTGNTSMQFEGCFFALGNLTDAELAAITADPTVLIEEVSAGSPPDAPTDISVTSITASGATVTWTDASSDETGFEVEYSTDPYSSWTEASTSPADADEESLAITGLDSGETYKVRVRAVNASGESDWLTLSGTFTTLVLKMKVLCHASAAGGTAVKGAVFAAPTGGALLGAPIGEFTGAAFEADLESGEAVLLVDVLDFGGGSLTTSSTPVVVFEGTTASGSSLGNEQPFGSVSAHEATVIEA